VKRPSRLLTLPLALLVASTLAGCSAGFGAATNRPYTPSNGTSLTVGTMDARNLLLVADETQPNTYKLIGALVNNAEVPETLTAVAVEGAGPIALTPITVPGLSRITTGALPTSTIVVPDATFALGDFTTITLTYSTQGSGTKSLLALTAEGTTSGG
jgi:hypothetical protein